jgi:hypothetical protein
MTLFSSSQRRDKANKCTWQAVDGHVALVLQFALFLIVEAVGWAWHLAGPLPIVVPITLHIFSITTAMTLLLQLLGHLLVAYRFLREECTAPKNLDTK